MPTSENPDSTPSAAPSAARATARSAAPAGGNYRRDIDGLRGLAIALVVFFHVFIGRVSSGVDVFLLIGGIFFFAPQIRNALNPTGQTLFQAVVRLLRRLYPALLTVIAASLLIGLLVYPRSRWAQLGEDATASLLYVQNLHLAEQSQDYAAIGLDVSVFQHIWSMSAQLQIYLGSLVVILLAALLFGVRGRRGESSPGNSARNSARSSARTGTGAVALSWLLVVATVTSFFYAVYLHSTDQGWNYYSPLSRFWEIGLGGLLGMFLLRRTIPVALAGWRWVAGVVGIVLIIGTGVFLDGAEQFPGPWTLVPLVGAALVILSGNRVDDGRHPTGVTRMLGTRPFQTLGRISYALYLWHWPLLVLATFHFSDGAASGSDEEGQTALQGITNSLGVPLGLAVGSGVVLLSLGLAWATQRFIETPLRQTRKPARAWLPDRASLRLALRNRRGITVVTAISVATVGVLVSGPAIRHTADSDEVGFSAADLDPELYPGPRALLDGAPVDDTVPVAPLSEDAPDYYPPTGPDGCAGLFGQAAPVLTQEFNNSDIPCAYGDVDAERTMYIAGSSHAEHFVPALDVIGKDEGIRVIPLLKMGCVIGMPLPKPDGSEYPECEEWNELAQQHIIDNPPTDGVFINTTRPVNPNGSGVDYAPQELVDLVARFTDEGIHTWGMRDTPWLRDDEGGVDARLCVLDEKYARDDSDDTVQDCGKPRSTVRAETNPALGEYDGLDITMLDVTDAMCSEDRCPGVVGNVLVYRDSSHLTNTYAEMLAPEVRRQMFAA